MEIHITNDRISDYGAALIEAIQQAPNHNIELVGTLFNFLQTYPTLSEQLAALMDTEVERDLYYELVETLGYIPLANIMEDHIGKPVLKRAGIVINPATQDELPEGCYAEIFFTRDTPEFVIDQPKKGSIAGNVELNIQAGSFYVHCNDKTAHVSGDADVALNKMHAIASGNCHLDLWNGCMVQVSDHVNISNQEGRHYIEVTGGHVQVDGDGSVTVVKGGAPRIEAQCNGIVVVQTPPDAVEQPRLNLQGNVVLITQSPLDSNNIALTVQQIQVGPQEGVMERLIETLKSTMADYGQYADSARHKHPLSQIKQDLIQLMPYRLDFRQKVNKATSVEQLIQLLPNYLPDLAKAGLDGLYLQAHFSKYQLEQHGIFVFPSSTMSQGQPIIHLFGPQLYSISSHTGTIHTYDHAIVTAGLADHVHAHGDSLLLAKELFLAHADEQSCILANSTRLLEMEDGTLAAISDVKQAKMSDYSTLLCERLEKLAGTDHAVTCLRAKAPENPEAYTGKAFEMDPSDPGRLYDVHSQACYYATPAMLFKDNQEQYQKACQTAHKVTTSRSR